MNKNKVKQLLLWAIMITALIGISIDVYNNAQGESLLHGFKTFKYFTLQSNTFILLFSVASLFVCNISKKSWFRYTLGPLTAYIILTGLVYLIILEPIYDSEGLKRLSSIILHYVTPPLMFAYWIISEERRYAYSEIFKWLSYPVLFMVWGLLLAITKGDYLYPFFDTSLYGANVAIYLILVAIGFSSMIMLLIFINNTFLTQKPAHKRVRSFDK